MRKILLGIRCVPSTLGVGVIRLGVWAQIHGIAFLPRAGLRSSCGEAYSEAFGGAERPDSPCGKFTRQAFDGNPIAMSEQLRFSSYVRWP